MSHWWKQIAGVVVLSLLATGIVTWMKPKQFLSTATALPASSLGSDRSRLFNENIQQLYSELGSPDDLDMVVGTAQLDTIYLTVTDQFNLFDHYQYKGPEARTKAARTLRCYSKVIKSDYGELKVKVWDTDKNLAPQLANAIVDILQSVHSKARNAGNESTLQSLKQALKNTRSSADSLSADNRKALDERATQYEKLISEYQLMVDSKPPALVIVEKARPAIITDRPKFLQIMIATAILSFLFSLLAALVLERKNLSRSEGNR
jgi:uncharacterized protein involved in exopolysaccharide biosynthesis